ncbi:hypothetical protein HDV03_000179 [Kappamyces sp. JEL0829]|nr:hypothetical protein HDV03_000179 [Kappamyces sp. JEL0829]
MNRMKERDDKLALEPDTDAEDNDEVDIARPPSPPFVAVDCGARSDGPPILIDELPVEVSTIAPPINTADVALPRDQPIPSGSQPNDGPAYNLRKRKPPKPAESSSTSKKRRM